MPDAVTDKKPVKMMAKINRVRVIRSSTRLAVWNLLEVSSKWLTKYTTINNCNFIDFCNIKYLKTEEILVKFRKKPVKFILLAAF